MTEPRPRIEAARAAGARLVVECDIPAEMTIGEWRKACAAERRAAAGSRPSAIRRLGRALRLR